MEDETDNLVYPHDETEVWDPDEEPPNGPWRDGKLWVLTHKCETCIFRPGNLMKLAEGRVDQMAQDCIEQDTIIPCHSTLDGPRSICRGLYDVHRSDITIMRMAAAMKVLAFDEPPGHDQ